MGIDIHTPSIDAVSAGNLENTGLRFALVDSADRDIFTAWFHAVNRGFNGPRVSDDDVPERLDNMADRRMVGVWDDGGADPATPVATSSAWVTELTLPGRTSIPAWAISTVTVAPTHRRRGVARNLLEAELRTAHHLGVPVAILTVSEATIYSRFGFAPSAMQADWTLDPTRARWTGPTPTGRMQLVPNDVLLESGLELIERVRLEVPGQIEFGGVFWRRLFGVTSDDKGRDIRSVRYDDSDGQQQGLAIYKVRQEPHSDDAVLEIKYLVAATADAYAALWRYLLEIDLITSVSAELRSIDEPVQWQIQDARAARKSHESDHLWTRILDVKAALEARRYAASGRFMLRVDDALGFASGRYLVEIAADGTAAVTPTQDAPDLALSITELSAIYLGGVSIGLLARAGRIDELTPGAAVAADASFRSDVTPWLSIWF